jgi:NhaA family Na+:H+ antiporter
MATIEKIIRTPFQKFFNIESVSGVLLFSATVIALLWANSPWGSVYHEIWEQHFGFEAGGVELNKPLILWVNDGLMAIFFFLIGLEIKRELLIGELNSIRKATLPFFAALGGMLIPVGCFFLLNQNPETLDGWGIPMATDIAFSLAILKVLGKRVPIGLIVFLTAFAIVDDIGAVVTIAVFYSSQINWTLMSIAFVRLLILFYLAYRGIYAKYLIFGFGAIIWVLFLKSGIHPTVAGILLAFSVPIRQKIGIKTYTDQLMTIAADIKEASNTSKPVLTTEQINLMDDLHDWTHKVQSPLQHLEHNLHGWVAYVIIPIFAFANAGIIFDFTADVDLSLALIIAGCLVIGKCIGIPLFTWISIRLGLAELPDGVNFGQVIGVGFLAGVGFTMSIFIANLAYAGDSALINSAKIGILLGSVVAAVTGYLVLRMARSSIRPE